ncbi:MAG TPA: hypothetical protein PLY59_10810 [Clostridiales bacterium]|nr:hypothetical protein [Clostridiales bacterium]HQD32064.1 hypothetical protein [Clostridiales bacterium]
MVSTPEPHTISRIFGLTGIHALHSCIALHMSDMVYHENANTSNENVE